MKNVKKMIQAGLKKFTVITILGVFLMTSLIPVSAATKVSKIKWSAYRKTMYVGNAQRFAVKITPAKASKAKLGWKTSNKKIAKVNKKGKVKAKKAGSVKITIKKKNSRAKGVVTPVKAGKTTITCYVKSQKSKKVTCKVTVKKQKVTAITFAKASVAVQKGKKVSNPAIVTPTYAANKKVTYKSSSTSVATVSTSGVVTGKKVGTATITATAADGSKKKNSYKVTVVAPITKNSAKFIAHRGLSVEAPENTIKAYELAGGAGFWGAETDVRMTKDKKFIPQHDLTFKRLCGVDKKPEDMTLSEIQKLTIKSGNNISKYKNVKSATTVATLEDYLTTCKKYNMVPVIEIKMEFVEYGNETTNDSRMQAVTKNNMEDLYALTNQIMGNKEYMFIAYDFETMVQMRKVLDDNATTSTNVKLQHVTNNPDQGMINYYKKRKIELDANCDKISLSDIKAFKDGGVNVGLWTVDDTERVADYIAQKVDYITTNTKFW